MIMKEWNWTKTAEAVLREQDTNRRGLDTDDALERRERYGPNRLAEGRKQSILSVFLAQFRDLLVVILCIAAVVSLISGAGESTIVIFAVLLLNAVLGTVQSCKAEQSLASLRAMSAPTARVLRDGVRQEIPSEAVVPGDIVLLEAGDLVVADGRILENFALRVDESALTGESVPVEKTAEALPERETALGDRINMVFSGALVTAGRATVVVTGTGMDTELGAIAQLMQQTGRRKTPLQISLDAFSKRLAAAILVICVLVFGLSVFRSGMPVVDALLFAVALAVAAIPEALSSIVTIVLAMGTQKMARQNAIVKELKAVESLGAVSVICSDKTGTLTQNRMTAEQVFVNGALVDADALTLEDPVHAALLHAALLASDATTDEDSGADVGDPTELALIRIGDQMGIDESDWRRQYPRISELAFDSDRKLMTTLHEIDGVPTLLTKGAPDVLLARVSRVLTAEGPKPLDDDVRARVLAANEAFSTDGLRVLAFACRSLDTARVLTPDDENDLTLIGLIAMIDPPRSESVRAVADARRGGIRTIMITGDHKTTAVAIAKKIGVFRDGDDALDGTELANMRDETLDARLPRITVYARVSPADKIRIVSAWQRRGRIVAMTGDGVNDAPALKRADIGVAMGRTGTEVSKDAAAMILADDNFATIVRAVVGGRAVYENIRNAIAFLLSGNMAGILAVLYAAVAGLAAPFAAVHLLFINLLTDSLPAIAIGMESARPGLLDRKPRDPDAPLLSRPLMRRILLQGALIAAVTMTAWHLGAAVSPACASTMAFATLALARLFHGFNCRGEESLRRLRLRTNRYALGAFAGGVALLALVLSVPVLSGLFLVAPLTGTQLLSIVGLAALPTLLIQAFRMLKGK